MSSGVQFIYKLAKYAKFNRFPELRVCKHISLMTTTIAGFEDI